MAGAGRSPPSSPLASAASPRPPSAMAHGGAGKVPLLSAMEGAARPGMSRSEQHPAAERRGASRVEWRPAAGRGRRLGGGRGGAVVDGGRRVVQQNHIGRKRVFSHSKYMIKKKEKMGNTSNGSMIKWLMFGVLFLQFSLNIVQQPYD